MSKYFIVKSTGVKLRVSEDVKVGEGKNATKLVEQYTKRPELYTPCDKDGKLQKAVKKEDQKTEDDKSEVK